MDSNYVSIMVAKIMQTIRKLAQSLLAGDSMLSKGVMMHACMHAGSGISYKQPISAVAMHIMIPPV